VCPYLLVCCQAGAVCLRYGLLHLLCVLLLSQDLIRGLLQLITLQVSPGLQALSLHTAAEKHRTQARICAALR